MTTMCTYSLGWVAGRSSEPSDVQGPVELPSDGYYTIAEPRVLDEAKLRSPAVLANQTCIYLEYFWGYGECGLETDYLSSFHSLFNK